MTNRSELFTSNSTFSLDMLEQTLRLTRESVETQSPPIPSSLSHTVSPLISHSRVFSVFFFLTFSVFFFFSSTSEQNQRQRDKDFSSSAKTAVPFYRNVNPHSPFNTSLLPSFVSSFSPSFRHIFSLIKESRLTPHTQKTFNCTQPHTHPR